MEVNKELLRRYADGECTPEEKLQVEAWLSEPDVISGEFDELKIQREYNVRLAAIERFMETDRGAKVIPLYKRLMRYAAATLILCIISISAYYFLSAQLSNESSEFVLFENYKSIDTMRGEKRTIKLTDGSTIRLNYETLVKVPEQFSDGERIIYLSGHAHFDVARDPDRPFIVYTENTKTQVLGTSFDINTKTAGETEIIVTSGKVAFSEKDRLANLVTLAENDRAVFNVGKSISTNEVNAQRLTAWRENRLVFDGQTLEKIIAVLEPWYDVKISVQDPNLLNRSFILAGDNPPLETFLRELCFAGRFQYRMEGNEIILY